MSYRSCTVKKQSSRRTVWVAEEAAKVGTVVEINGDGGWEIVLLSSIVWPLELVLARSSDPIAKKRL
jgi:hypothetical protein